MLPDPLHPAVVHFPIALAALMPLIAFAMLVAGWRGWLPEKRAWAIAAVFQGLVFAGTLAGVQTGEREEDKVEQVVSEAAIHEHEEAAEYFRLMAGVVLGVTLVPFFVPGAALRRGAAAVATVGTLVVLATAIRTGELGGELVYKHGAASAYQTGGGVVPAAVGEDEGGRGRGRGRGGEDDED